MEKILSELGLKVTIDTDFYKFAVIDEKRDRSGQIKYRTIFGHFYRDFESAWKDGANYILNEISHDYPAEEREDGIYINDVKVFGKGDTGYCGDEQSENFQIVTIDELFSYCKTREDCYNLFSFCGDVEELEAEDFE